MYIRRAGPLVVAGILFWSLSVFANEVPARIKDDREKQNRKYSLLIPLVEVPLINGMTWAFNRYVGDRPFARISMQTVKANFENGWVWDTDDFPTNFSLHPYSGSAFFNSARSNGYGFYQSMPFVLGGSLMWEYFMERTRPSYNDLINTTASGIFLGEVLHRLSSEVLDDRATGANRIFREVLATIINPVRGFNRLIHREMFQVVPNKVYEKHPFHFRIAVGARDTTEEINIPDRGRTGILNLNLSYGDAFEETSRKPFDYFDLHAEFSSGKITEMVKNVTGDAFLWGGPANNGPKIKTLFGVFQHYDYWNTEAFEIGTIGLGGTVLASVPFAEKNRFQNELHLAAVPLGASNERRFPTDGVNTGFRNYAYAGGAELKYETRLDLNWMRVGAQYYLYWLRTYVGPSRDSTLTVLRPQISVRLLGPLHLAYEYLQYNRNDNSRERLPNFHITTGEQRFYLLVDN